MKINKIIMFSHVCDSSLLRVSWCVWCSLSCLFEYMCTRLPFIWFSIAGVPSSQALLGYLITAPPSVCVPDVIGALPVWIQQPKKKGSCLFACFYEFADSRHSCVVCVYFLLYLSFYLCCARCVFCVQFYIPDHLFIFFLLFLQIW